MTFQARLKAVCKGGNLRVADLARWFEKPHATVRGWVEKGIQPAGGPLDVEHVVALTALLEQLIARKKGLPVPRLSPSARISHMRELRERCLPAGK